MKKSEMDLLDELKRHRQKEAALSLLIEKYKNIENSGFYSEVKNIFEGSFNYSFDDQVTDIDLSVLNDILSNLLTLESENEVLDFIGQKLSNIFQDAIILINKYEHEEKQTTIHNLYYTNNTLVDKAFHILGFSPVGRKYRLNTTTEAIFRKGTLQKIDGGLKVLSKGYEANASIDKIIKLLQLKDVYFIGLMKNNQLYAGVQFYTSHHSRPIQKQLVEAIILQTSAVLQKKNYEKQLIESKEKYKNLFFGAQNPITIFDLEARVIMINNYYHKLMKPGFKDVTGKLVKDFLPDKHNFYLEKINQVVSSGKSIQYDDELVLNNNHIYLWSVMQPLVNKENEIYGAQVFSYDMTDKRRAEKDLHKFNENYSRLVHMVGEGIGIVDENERFVFCNQAAERIFEVPTGELTGKSLSEFMDDDAFNHMQQETNKRKQGLESKYEVKITTRKGNQKCLLLTATPNILYDDGFQGTLGVFSDITEKKNYEQKLKETNNKFNALLANSRDILYCRNLKTNAYEYISDSVYYLLGYSKEEFKFLPLEKVLGLTHPNDKNRVNDLIEESFKNGKEANSHQNIVYRLKHKNGSYRWISDNVSVIFDDTGEPYYQVGNARDITNQVEAENQLKDSEEKFRILAENSSDGIVLFINNKVSYISPKFLEMMGYSKMEAINADLEYVFGMIHPEDREKAMMKLEDSRTRKLKNFTLLFRFRKKDGIYFWMENRFSRKFDEQENIIQTICNSRDISDRIYTEQQLNELIATKDKLFSIIGHDLKSPFASIAGFSDLLIKSAKENNCEKVIKHSSIIQQASKQGLALLNNLLEWGRIQQGTNEYNPQLTSLEIIITDAVQMVYSVAKQKRIRIEQQIEPGLQAMVDNNMVSTILRNLLSNAVKFTQVGGTIQVNVFRNRENVEFSVHDNGVGIADDVKEKLFTDGPNESTNGTDNEKGTGLGLMLCKELVGIHKGNIWVESKPGEGSTFFFTLPVTINEFSNN